jgi:protein subunit release factor A
MIDDQSRTTVAAECVVEVIYVQTGTTQRPGGQQAGSPATAVRVFHWPSGTMAQCSIHSSPHRNRQAAVEMIEWALAT